MVAGLLLRVVPFAEQPCRHRANFVASEVAADRPEYGGLIAKREGVSGGRYQAVVGGQAVEEVIAVRRGEDDEMVRLAHVEQNTLTVGFLIELTDDGLNFRPPLP